MKTFKQFLQEAHGIFEPISDREFEIINRTLIYRGGVIIRDISGEPRVLTNGSTTLKQRLSQRSNK